MAVLLKTNGLKTNFHTFEGVVHALNGVNVVVHPGETYGLVGESGCGKSVTVRSMMRIVQSPGKIEAGKIVIFFDEKNEQRGVNLLHQSEAYMEQIRGNDISMIFQEASTALNPVFSIEDQVGESFEFHRLEAMLKETIADMDKALDQGSHGFLGLHKLRRYLFAKELQSHERYQKAVDALDAQIIGLENDDSKDNDAQIASLNKKRESLRSFSLPVKIVQRVPFLKRYRRTLKKTIRRHIVELLRSLGLPNPENVVDRYPHELSGGMQQRIVIAIALACHPKLLIADEPTSNLDVTIQAQIVDLIKKLKESIITSVIFITHDLGLVAELCDRVSVMYAGDVAETAAVKKIFKEQYHPYTQGLIASIPKRDQTGTLQPIPGTVPNLVSPPSGCRFHPRCPKAMDICSRVKPQTIEKDPEHFVACHLYYKHDENTASKGKS